MPNCPDCRPWPPKDTDTEPESDLSYDKESMTVTGTVRIHNDCENCGQELEETTFEIEIDCADVVEKHKKAFPGLSHTIDEDSIDVERSDGMQMVDRRGKPITNPRYRARLYGVDVQVQLQCSCGEDIDAVNYSDNVKASYMESLV